jgi:hypothetical protein
MLAGTELLQQPGTVFDREKAVVGAFVVAPSVAWFHMDGHIRIRETIIYHAGNIVRDAV